jgi:aubergine-like protein
MARYGQNKTYKVSAVKWDMTPQTCEFEQGEVGKTISMVLYFQQQYDVAIMDLNQPLFEIKQKRQNIYLPPELCTLVGIPQRVRENKRIMASMRQSLFQKPHDRIKSICNLNAMIAQSKEVKQWGLEIELTPDTIEASVLERPKIFETPNF